MKDLKHLIYFESLLENADNELVKQAQAEGDICLGYTCYHVPEVPEAVVGAGTLLTVEQLKAAKAAGAAFGVAPGFDPAVVAEAKAQDLPFCPGIATASELSQALTAGCKMVKFFPAEAAGGVKMIKNLLGAFRFTGVTKFAFLSLSTHKEDSKGNLIDQVYFTTSEPIQTAALRVIATAGGSARVNDGGAELANVVLGAPYSRVVGIGSRVVISPVAEEGWSFLGLYCDSKFHPFGACDGLLAFDMPPADRRVTLIFARDRTITFNPEGGSYVDESYRLSTSSPEYTLGTPNRSGYVFKGWRELTSGNVYAAGEMVRYEVDAQYDETVRSYLVIGKDATLVRAESERGHVL